MFVIFRYGKLVSFVLHVNSFMLIHPICWLQSNNQNSHYARSTQESQEEWTILGLRWIVIGVNGTNQFF